MKKIGMLIFCFVLLGLVLLAIWVTYKPREVAHISFPNQPDASLLVNGQELLSTLDQKGKKIFTPASFSALKPNIISLGSSSETVTIDKIKPDDFITVDIEGEKAHTFTLHLFPATMPRYKIKSKGVTPGYWLLTPFEGSCIFSSYGYIVHTNGDLLYYRSNTNSRRCLSDFKKTVLPNGEVLFSIMEQEKPMPPFNYWFGRLLVFDKNFNLLNTFKLLPTSKHPMLDVENHESLILDKDHIILSAYYHTEQMIPGEEYPARVTAVIIQEIKDGKVIFEWNSTDYPQLYKGCLTPCDYKQVAYQDYLHFNSFVIDPKDNNLVLSFRAASSIIKIDRKTGDILWTLGGLGDDFLLSADQRFASQHAVSFLPSGELMIFDNHAGNEQVWKQAQITPSLPLNTRSRILLFKLDEKNHTVTDFREIPLSYHATTLGSVYFTKNNTFIVGYGSSRDMAAQELDERGKARWSMKILNPMYVSYRAYKYTSLY